MAEVAGRHDLVLGRELGSEAGQGEQHVAALSTQVSEGVDVGAVGRGLLLDEPAVFALLGLDLQGLVLLAIVDVILLIALVAAYLRLEHPKGEVAEQAGTEPI